MHEILQTLRSVETPAKLSRKELSKKCYGKLSLEELERLKVEKIIQVLGNPSLSKLVEEGFITFAMIKPATPNLLGVDDLEAAQKIEEAIQPPLELVFSSSLVFDDELVDKFYSGESKDIQQRLQAYMHRESFKNRWEEFVSLMKSGPSTVLLLYSPTGDAVTIWRSQIGHWNVEKERDSTTLRGKFALSNYNAITHGSDSIVAVLKEIGIIKDYLTRFFLTQ